jgi:hypothetical protein
METYQLWKVKVKDISETYVVTTDLDHDHAVGKVISNKHQGQEQLGGMPPEVHPVEKIEHLGTVLV